MCPLPRQNSVDKEIERDKMNLGDNYSTELEEKVEKVDCRQWLPVVGLAQVMYDHKKGNPTVIEDNYSRFLVSAAVHGTGLVGLVELIHYLVR